MSHTDEQAVKPKKKPVRITSLQQARRVIKIVIGFTVVLFGVVGLFLPFLQGIITIVLGLAILGTEFLWARRLMKRFQDGANNMKNSIFNNSINRNKKQAAGKE
jgi:uncharacterized membrane protein YbaN (DUF454 family)